MSTDTHGGGRGTHAARRSHATRRAAAGRTCDTPSPPATLRQKAALAALASEASTADPPRVRYGAAARGALAGGDLLVLSAGTLAYDGSHPGNASIPTADACRDACAALPSCNAWTFCGAGGGCGGGCKAYTDLHPKSERPRMGSCGARGSRGTHRPASACGRGGRRARPSSPPNVTPLTRGSLRACAALRSADAGAPGARRDRPAPDRRFRPLDVAPLLRRRLPAGRSHGRQHQRRVAVWHVHAQGCEGRGRRRRGAAQEPAAKRGFRGCAPGGAGSGRVGACHGGMHLAHQQLRGGHVVPLPLASVPVLVARRPSLKAGSLLTAQTAPAATHAQARAGSPARSPCPAPAPTCRLPPAPPAWPRPTRAPASRARGTGAHSPRRGSPS